MRGIRRVSVAVVALSTSVAAGALEDNLIGRMTFEEKVGQVVQVSSGLSLDPVAADSSHVVAQEGLVAMIRAGRTGALLGTCGVEKYNLLQRVARESRLGIPLLVGGDLVHGVFTTLPTPLALSAAWDEDLWFRAGLLIADEGPLAGCNWTFAPMVDIARDARWGRIVESPGQDPYLAARFAAAMVRGIQGGQGAPMAACLKHFIAYGAVEGGRDYAEVELGERTLRNVYLPPFAAGVRAGALTVMPAFHTVNGVPCSLNRRLLTDILRGELGFDGFCVSDNGAIHESGPAGHACAEDMAHVAAQALAAGLDMDMTRRTGRAYPDGLPSAVQLGLLSTADLDRSVRTILSVKRRLGLFENPFIDAVAQSNSFRIADCRKLAREAAAKCAVLLKNEKGVLPLKPNVRVAVVGPFADDAEIMFDSWSFDRTVRANATLREGLLADRVMVVDDLDRAEVIVGTFGEGWDENGEDRSKTRLELPAEQLRLLERLKRTGKPLVAVLFTGRPLAVPELAAQADALLVGWNAGSCGGWGIADVLTGAAEPCGRLTCDFPQTTGQCPIYYNRLPTGRPNGTALKYVTRHIDAPYEPLFGFGDGLAYTKFDLGGTRARVDANGVVLSAKVSNAGARRGRAVVQAYVRRLYADISCPVRELRGFACVNLEPGESKSVALDVKLDPGTYDVVLAQSARTGNPVRITIGGEGVR